MKTFSIFRKDKTLLNFLKKLVVDLPCPMKISFFWKFGSLLGVTFLFQFVTGLLLSMHYVSDANIAFESVDQLSREVWKGWLIRYLHISGASLFFIFMYFHIARSIYYFSFNLVKTWKIGVLNFVVAMAIAFLGYVLPWGQMSYWGATVITKFFSVFPYVGQGLVIWIWGGFAVDYPTLTRFFSLHFLLPFILLFLILLHFIFLHDTGSSNPLGLNSKKDKVLFFPLFLSKDFLGFFIIFFLFFIFFLFPSSFMEYQKFVEANSLVTPTHIQPEWYFLSAYAILRSIPKKLGGVLGLFFFVLILFIFPFFYFLNFKEKFSLRNSSFNFFFQFFFWVWIMKFFFLTWIGACAVEYPFLELSRVSSFIYFMFFFCFYFV